MKVNPIPEGFHTVTPYLVVNGASEFLNFLKSAFDAEVRGVHKSADGGMIMNAEVKIGDSVVMFGDVMPGMDAIPAMLYLYVKDADSLYQKVIKAGGKSIHEMKDQFYGDRSGAVEDRWGNKWWIATRIEQVNEAELAKRMSKMKM